MERTAKFVVRIVTAALVGVCTSTIAYAQQMNFSYYSDIIISSDQQTLYTIVDGFDNSSGCQHYDYQSVGYVYGPNGFYSQQSFPGLQTFVGAPVGEGDYSFYSDSTVNCSCFGSGLGAGGGGGATKGVAFRHHYQQTAFTPGQYSPKANTIFKQCSHSSYKWTNPPNPVPYEITAAGLYFGGSLIDTCIQMCSPGTPLPAIGPVGTVYGEQDCG